MIWKQDHAHARNLDSYEVSWRLRCVLSCYISLTIDNVVSKMDYKMLLLFNVCLFFLKLFDQLKSNFLTALESIQ